MLLYRCLSTTTRTTYRNVQTLASSEVVKYLSKFSSHDKLMEYSERPIEYCYGPQMIEMCSPNNLTATSLIKLASDLQNQLLLRIAHCISYFQVLPFLPAANPTLLSIQERYLNLFETLLHFSKIDTVNDEEKFYDIMSKFTYQSSDFIAQLTTGCREAQKYFKSYETMKDFLDSVLQIRLAMRLLAEHYLEAHKQQRRNISDKDWRGIICMNFSPANTVKQCVDDVSSICFETYSVVPHVQIENRMPEPIPYFPFVVEYILRELLKNSMRAIVEYNRVVLGNMQNVKAHLEDRQGDAALCKVLIATNPNEEYFTIVIQDQGGGIAETNEKLFRYMFTGKEVKKEEPEEETSVIADFQECVIQSTKQMYGHGIGLPICRLYSQFFGGSLTLRQVFRIGVDVYLRLGFIHTNSQRIKI